MEASEPVHPEGQGPRKTEGKGSRIAVSRDI